jgi:hypothetical protein
VLVLKQILVLCNISPRKITTAVEYFIVNGITNSVILTKNDIYILIPCNQAPKTYLVYRKTSLLEYFTGLKNMHGKQCKTISTKRKLVMEKWNEKHEI